ncbi:MAG: hypothetical protein RLZZ468_224 [Cyanobacteriota bacterium]|jgi:hypothetical protein
MEINIDLEEEAMRLLPLLKVSEEVRQREKEQREGTRPEEREDEDA